MTNKMKVIIYEEFGGPEVLKFSEIKKPIPKDNEVLIKIYATSVSRGDIRMRKFDIPGGGFVKLIAHLFLGIKKPKNQILGIEFSGEIEEVGNKVLRFKKGDKVFGNSVKFGGYSEYKTILENKIIALKPNNMSYEEAAPLAGGGFTAFNCLKNAKIESGQKILIYGASGSTGSYAIQLAKHYGAEVTAVVSTGKIEMVKSLGADIIIDYTTEDFTEKTEKYDVVFDAVAKIPKKESLKVLKENGVYLNVHSDSGSTRDSKYEYLEVLKDLAESGKIRTYIDRNYSWDDIVEAHRYVDEGHKKGNVTITIRS